MTVVQRALGLSEEEIVLTETVQQEDVFIFWSEYLEELLIVIQRRLRFVQTHIPLGDCIEAQLFAFTVFQFARDCQALDESFQRPIRLTHSPGCCTQILEYQLLAHAVTGSSGNGERLIEILYCIERLEQLLNDPEILSKHVRAIAHPNALEGVGACEAPRGTLFHHYKIDEQGLIRWVNLVIATGHNNLAMNRSVLQVAKHFVQGKRLTPGMLNRVEAVIRCYDPCLSCSTHALGQMDLQIQLISPQGEVLDEVIRK